MWGISDYCVGETPDGKAFQRTNGDEARAGSLPKKGQLSADDDYRSIPDGLVLVATIIFWSFILDWLGYQVPAIQRCLFRTGACCGEICSAS